MSFVSKKIALRLPLYLRRELEWSVVVVVFVDDVVHDDSMLIDPTLKSPTHQRHKVHSYHCD